MRIGQGYDVHKLVEDRRLVICGVEIPHTLGLLGHSDADVGWIIGFEPMAFRATT